MGSSNASSLQMSSSEKPAPSLSNKASKISRLYTPRQETTPLVYPSLLKERASKLKELWYDSDVVRELSEETGHPYLRWGSTPSIWSAPTEEEIAKAASTGPTSADSSTSLNSNSSSNSTSTFSLS